MNARILATMLSLTIFLPPALAANPQQSGTGGDCIDDIATFFQSEQLSPIATIVSVGADTVYTVSGNTYVDFFDSAGLWIGWNGGLTSGIVPSDAAFGTICTWTTTVTGYPVPNPAGAWTYQDGF